MHTSATIVSIYIVASSNKHSGDLILHSNFHRDSLWMDQHNVSEPGEHQTLALLGIFWITLLTLLIPVSVLKS